MQFLTDTTQRALTDTTQAPSLADTQQCPL